MKKFIFGFFIVLIFAFLFVQNIKAENVDVSQIVRVGISDNSFSKYLFDKVSISSTDAFTVTDNNSQEISLNGYEVVDVTLSNDGFAVYSNSKLLFKTDKNVVFIPAPQRPLAVIGLKRKSKQALYLGNIELVRGANNSNKFAVVNVLPLQSYLKGVVPNEMPVSFGLEALKAQAVLARNYVLKPHDNAYKSYFDICDSVACQVYYGANTYSALSNRAVDETENMVVTYKNDLILALYSSTSGGYTEDYKNVFLRNTSKGVVSQNIPYLVSAPDNADIPNLSDEEKMREFYSSTPNTFDNASPYFRWKREWSLEDLEKTLSSTIPTVQKSGFVKTKFPVDYSKSDYFGNIKSIEINKRGNSGKIVAMTIKTSKNDFTIYKELIIRKVFLNNGKMLPSANVFFDFVKNEDDTIKLVATGGGFGHGVGMSQWGAGAMAKQGYSFSDIIHHYYKDVKIALLPVVVPSQREVIQVFYNNSQKTFLTFENKLHFLNLEIIINDRELSSDLIEKLKTNHRVEITDYLKKGRNTVVYKINSENNKEATFWVETEAKNEFRR